MTDKLEQYKEKLFVQIRDALASLEEGDISDMDRTEVIFDVMEQIMARCVAGTAVDQDSVKEVCDATNKNIQELASTFFTEMEGQVPAAD